MKSSLFKYLILLISLRLSAIGMVKNQKLPANILTPTTKAADHDVPITPEEVCNLLFYPSPIRLFSLFYF